MSATHFQRDTVSFWNDFHNEVTKSNCLGLNFGLVEESDCGAWKLKPGCKEMCCHLAGDVKRVMSLTFKSDHCLCKRQSRYMRNFVEALQQIVEVPGD